LVSPIEHSSVLEVCRELAGRGFEIGLLPVDRYGQVDPEDVRRSIRRDTILVSVMMAHNEIGTLYPAGEIGAICREKGAFFHCDGVQAVGKIPVDVGAMNIDLLSISGHKMYGPKGV